MPEFTVTKSKMKFPLSLRLRFLYISWRYKLWYMRLDPVQKLIVDSYQEAFEKAVLFGDRKEGP
jgi:hypothetical protein